MEPILLIGAAAAAVVAIVAFARRFQRRHGVAVPSPPRIVLLDAGTIEVVKSPEIVPTGPKQESPRRGPESGDDSLSRGAESVESLPEEVLKGPSGNEDVSKAEPYEAQETQREALHLPELLGWAGTGVGDERRIGVEGERESERKTAQSADAPTGPGVNLAGEGTHGPNPNTEGLLGARSQVNAFMETGASAPELAAGVEDVKAVEVATADVAGPETVDVATPVESEKRAPAQLEETASGDRENSSEESNTSYNGTKSPRQYRPVVRKPPKPQVSSVRKDQGPQPERPLSLAVRLVFEPGGFCRASLLPQRIADLPQEILVSGADGGGVELVTLQEDWYQDVALADIGKLLRCGIEWEATLPESRKVRWSLSGREVYVLAPHDSLSGYVSAPRLALGEPHVVLSAVERRTDVLRAIKLTGSPDPDVIAAPEGIPAGWIGFRGVIPHIPVAPSVAGDILDVLCPLADTEIVLKGGIRIGRSTWLTDYPPIIQLRGYDKNVELNIDGHEATKDGSGAYTTHGWDFPGDHVIWSASASKSYSISAGLESWAPWDAYGWSWRESSEESERSRPTICGVLVRSPRNAASGSRGVVGSGSNPIFIGARVGEIEVCRTPPGVRTNVAIGFPVFDPVWAVPADALHSDKRVARVVLAGRPRVPEATNIAPAWASASNTRQARRQNALRARAWCSVILDVGRKGLQPEPNTTEISALWKQYKLTAKRVRRALR